MFTSYIYFQDLKVSYAYLSLIFKKGTTVPHVGCLEMKVIKGIDGRVYALEAMRMTPRDANYVKVSGRGDIVEYIRT